MRFIFMFAVLFAFTGSAWAMDVSTMNGYWFKEQTAVRIIRYPYMWVWKAPNPEIRFYKIRFLKPISQIEHEEPVMLARLDSIISEGGVSYKAKQNTYYIMHAEGHYSEKRNYFQRYACSDPSLDSGPDLMQMKQDDLQKRVDVSACSEIGKKWEADSLPYRRVEDDTAFIWLYEIPWYVHAIAPDFLPLDFDVGASSLRNP